MAKISPSLSSQKQKLRVCSARVRVRKRIWSIHQKYLIDFLRLFLSSNETDLSVQSVAKSGFKMMETF
jgi:hypothetical protein